MIGLPHCVQCLVEIGLREHVLEVDVRWWGIAVPQNREQHLQQDCAPQEENTMLLSPALCTVCAIQMPHLARPDATVTLSSTVTFQFTVLTEIS